MADNKTVKFDPYLLDDHGWKSFISMQKDGLKVDNKSMTPNEFDAKHSIKYSVFSNETVEKLNAFSSKIDNALGAIAAQFDSGVKSGKESELTARYEELKDEVSKFQKWMRASLVNPNVSGDVVADMPPESGMKTLKIKTKDKNALDIIAKVNGYSSTNKELYKNIVDQVTLNRQIQPLYDSSSYLNLRRGAIHTSLQDEEKLLEFVLTSKTPTEFKKAWEDKIYNTDLYSYIFGSNEGDRSPSDIIKFLRERTTNIGTTKIRTRSAMQVTGIMGENKINLKDFSFNTKIGEQFIFDTPVFGLASGSKKVQSAIFNNMTNIQRSEFLLNHNLFSPSELGAFMYSNGVNLPQELGHAPSREEMVHRLMEMDTRTLFSNNKATDAFKMMSRDAKIAAIKQGYNAETDAVALLELIQEGTGMSLHSGASMVGDPASLYKVALGQDVKDIGYSYQIGASLQDYYKSFTKEESLIKKFNSFVYDARSNMVEELKWIHSELNDEVNSMDRTSLSWDEQLVVDKKGKPIYDTTETARVNAFENVEKWKAQQAELGDVGGFSEGPMLHELNKARSPYERIELFDTTYTKDGQTFNGQGYRITDSDQILKDTNGNVIVQQLENIVDENGNRKLQVGTKRLNNFLPELSAAKITGDTIHLDSVGPVTVKEVDVATGTAKVQSAFVNIDQVEVAIKDILKPTKAPTEVMNRADIEAAFEQLTFRMQSARATEMRVQGNIEQLIDKSSVDAMFKRIRMSSGNQALARDAMKNHIENNIFNILFKHGGWSLFENMPEAISTANYAHLNAIAELGSIDIGLKADGSFDLNNFTIGYADKFNKYFYKHNNTLKSNRQPLYDKIISEYDKLPLEVQNNVSLLTYMQQGLSVQEHNRFYNSAELNNSVANIRKYISELGETGETPRINVSLEQLKELGKDIPDSRRLFNGVAASREFEQRVNHNFVDAAEEVIYSDIDFKSESKAEAAGNIKRTYHMVDAAQRKEGITWDDNVFKVTDYDTMREKLSKQNGGKKQFNKAMSVQLQPLLGDVYKEMGDPEIMDEYIKTFGNKSIPKKNMAFDMIDTIIQDYTPEEAYTRRIAKKRQSYAQQILNGLDSEEKKVWNSRQKQIKADGGNTSQLVDEILAKHAANEEVRLQNEALSEEAMIQLKRMTPLETREFIVNMNIRDKQVADSIIKSASLKAKVRAVQSYVGSGKEMSILDAAVSGKFTDDEITSIAAAPQDFGISDKIVYNDTTALRRLATGDGQSISVNGEQYTAKIVGNELVAFDSQNKRAFNIGESDVFQISGYSDKSSYIRRTVHETMDKKDKLELFNNIQSSSIDRVGNKLSNQTSVATIQTAREFVNRDGSLKMKKEFLGVDYEMTGLPGTVNDNMLIPTEVNIQRWNLSGKIANGDTKIFVKPTEEIKEYVNSLYSLANGDKVAEADNSITELNSKVNELVAERDSIIKNSDATRAAAIEQAQKDAEELLNAHKAQHEALRIKRENALVAVQAVMDRHSTEVNKAISSNPADTALAKLRELQGLQSSLPKNVDELNEQIKNRYRELSAQGLSDEAIQNDAVRSKLVQQRNDIKDRIKNLGDEVNAQQSVYDDIIKQGGVHSNIEAPKELQGLKSEYEKYNAEFAASKNRLDEINNMVPEASRKADVSINKAVSDIDNRIESLNANIVNATKTKESLVKELDDFNNGKKLTDENVWFLRNYAKYSPEVYDYMAQEAGGSGRIDGTLFDLYTNPDSQITPDKYKRLVYDAKKGMEFVENNKYSMSIEDAVNTIHDVTKNKIIVGQNYSNADALFLQNIANRVAGGESIDKNKLIDTMHMFGIAEPGAPDRKLSTQGRVLLGKMVDNHIASEDVTSTVEGFIAMMKGAESGKYPELMEVLKKKQTLRRGQYLVKHSGGDELGDIIHGVYKYHGLRDTDTGVELTLADASVKGPDNKVVLKAKNMQELQGILDSDYSRIDKSQAKEYIKYYADDYSRRNVSRAQSGYIGLAIEAENSGYALGDVDILDRLEATRNEYLDTRKRVAGLSSEGLDALFDNARGGDKAAQQDVIYMLSQGYDGVELSEKIDNVIEGMTKRYPEGQAGLRKDIMKGTADWLSSNQGQILAPAFHHVKVLEDSKYLTRDEGKSILRSINETIANYGTEKQSIKTRQYSFMRNLATRTMNNGNVSDLYMNTTSENTVAKSLRNVMTLVKKDMQQAAGKDSNVSFGVGNLREIIAQANPGAMAGTENISTLSSLAKHIYQNRDQFGMANIVDRGIVDIADADRPVLESQVNEIIHNAVNDKYSRALSENQIKDIMDITKQTAEENEARAAQYLKENVTIGAQLPAGNHVVYTSKGEITTVEKLFDTANSYLRQDYGMAYQHAREGFKEWFNDKNRNASNRNWSDRYDEFMGEFNERIKPKIDELQELGIPVNPEDLSLGRGADKETARYAWRELNKLANDTSQPEAMQQAREKLNWKSLGEIADIEINEGPRAAWDALGESVMTQGNYRGMAFKDIDIDTFIKRDNKAIRDEQLVKRADRFVELSEKLQLLPGSDKRPYAELPGFVDDELNNILDDMTKKYRPTTNHTAEPINMKNAARGVEEAVEAAVSDSENITKNFEWTKGKVAAVGVALGLAGLIVGGMKVRSPEENAYYQAQDSENKGITYGPGNSDWNAKYGSGGGSQKTVRTDDGAVIKVRGKSRKPVSSADMAGAVSGAVSSVTSNINVTTRDNSQQIDKKWMEDQFINLVKG